MREYSSRKAKIGQTKTCSPRPREATLRRNPGSVLAALRAAAQALARSGNECWWRDPGPRLRIGFVQCDDGVPPARCARFDCRGLAPSGLRKLKRWVSDRAATWLPPKVWVHRRQSESMTSAAPSRPARSRSTGGAPLAYAFVRALREGFDEVFRLELRLDRTPAALAATWARKSICVWKAICRTTSRNCANLLRLAASGIARRPEGVHAGCSLSRKLLHADRGRIGTMESLAPNPSEPSSTSLRTRAAMSDCVGLARIGRRIARDQNRIAELYELLLKWYALAKARGDRQSSRIGARDGLGSGGWATRRGLAIRTAAAYRVRRQMTLPFE